MKTDQYTKFILTIIAICLTVNVVKEFNFIPQAHANDQPLTPTLSTEYRLVPISEANTIDVRIVDVNTYDALNVNLKDISTYDKLNVNLKSIETSDELDVNIDEVGGGWISHGGPIKVKVD